MGLSFSCPFGDYKDLDNSLDSIVVKSICLGNDEEHKSPTKKTTLSFNTQDADLPTILNSLGKKIVLQGANSLNNNSNDTGTPDSLGGPICVDTPLSDTSNNVATPPPKHEAALKLQKFYKSFRTRRKLADCAVLLEQSWWELLDFAELKHSSISFFDMDHHETAVSRWCRAKTRAAKVGKGLSKNGKAQKLALQHWLEAIDPRHRYGHNLHFYYAKWHDSQSRQPFFYWLDIGEGKEVNLEKCPRSKLHQQCIKYLGPMERLAYEVSVDNGKLIYKQSGELLDTSKEPHAKWIFVLSTSKALYVGKKKKGTFQHSSFLAGGATTSAGRLVVENGLLKAVWPHSGHYRPTPENFQEFLSFLRENSVDLTDVKMDPVDEDDRSLMGKQSSIHHFRNDSSEEDFSQDVQLCNKEANFEDLSEEKTSPKTVPEVKSEELVPEKPKRRFCRGGSLTRKLTKILIPRQDLYSKMQHENASSHRPTSSSPSLLIQKDDASSPLNGREGENHHPEQHQDASVSVEEATKDHDDSILQRINSHKEAKSYQLGKQLSCKWTTGAGPRISCVRDYPSKLQFHALEQVSLSPRSSSSCCYSKSPLGSHCRPRSLQGRDDQPKSSPLTQLTPSSL